MPKYVPADRIERIKKLRSQGWSLPEIHKEVGVGYGTVSKYIKGVEILPRYRSAWLSKRNGSKARKEKAEAFASKRATQQIPSLSDKERLLSIAALYWGEGGKSDFNFTNSDPEMIRIFVSGLKKVLNIGQDNIRASIRIYEDLDRDVCLRYWSKITNIPVDEFVNVDVLRGKKTGKLTYGLCRIRVKKGGDMLKYLLAVNKRVSALF